MTPDIALSKAYSAAVPGVSTSAERVRNFLDSDRAAWYNHVNITAHDHGGHFIPWEIPGEWVDDLRRTVRGQR